MPERLGDADEADDPADEPEAHDQGHQAVGVIAPDGTGRHHEAGVQPAGAEDEGAEEPRQAHPRQPVRGVARGITVKGAPLREEPAQPPVPAQADDDEDDGRHQATGAQGQHDDAEEGAEDVVRLLEGDDGGADQRPAERADRSPHPQQSEPAGAEVHLHQRAQDVGPVG
ncbi:hypothetical protein [Streptomyces sp. NPDC047939]|uniref:hypothetical protein n=1 Tax=Streptomyces sp. NPDC047939 TaxID=3155381 RepID=UPI003432808E